MPSTANDDLALLLYRGGQLPAQRFCRQPADIGPGRGGRCSMRARPAHGSKLDARRDWTVRGSVVSLAGAAQRAGRDAWSWRRAANVENDLNWPCCRRPAYRARAAALPARATERVRPARR
ncbi:hypothetical protein ACU4GD_39385 [Cupriavidus basilensis]